ncbi:hypothetical protein ANN_24062 [Periplaneta americana]|uniref:Uncharacterized protein n=1 Tax=Periplaneta americana TaxID=6978 RepID=A0ABQ8S214_PERAM|nr:hypothetical protein ANN_24062 [Periplaneta americana]
MAGLCEGGNEPSGSLKAICKRNTIRRLHTSSIATLARFLELQERRRNSENMMRAQVPSSLVRPRRTCFCYVLFEALVRELHQRLLVAQSSIDSGNVL